MPPEVSVVIPTRNRWALLQSALGCALAQRDVELEVIVVDDSSDEEHSEQLIDPADHRVQHLRLRAPAGVARARNAGVAAARGRWISLLDDDDLWAPDKLRRQLDAAGAAGFVYASAVVVEDDRRPVAIIRAPEPAALARDLLQRNVVPAGSSNVIVRADTLRVVGGFDERFAHLDDWDLWIRLALRAQSVAVDEVLVGQRRHRGNRFVSDGEGLLDEFRELEAKHRIDAARVGVRFDGLDFARWVAHGHRRGGRRLASASAYVRAGIEHRDPKTIARGAAVLAAGRPRRRSPSPAPRIAWLAEPER